LNNNLRQLIGINLTTLNPEFFADTGQGPRDMVIGSDGTIYVANAVDDTLSIVSPTAGVQEVIELQGEYPISLALTENDTLYIAHYLSDAITKRTPGGEETYFELPGILPSDIEIDTDNNAYIVSEGTGIITRISTSNQVSTYAQLPYQSHNISFDTDGNLIALHPYDNAISKIYGTDHITTIENIGDYPVEMFSRPEAIYIVSKESDSIDRVNITASGLLPLTRPIYRFWSPDNSRHFFTMSTSEKRDVVNNFENNVWSYENVGFYALNAPAGDAVPVYRFWSPSHSTHFYTLSETEKLWIEETFPPSVWTYEGIAYYAFEQDTSDTSAVYRFWSPTKNTHFFTTSEVEKNWIEDTFDESIWTYEGEAFYTY
jgi:DNA-binding beta-propeller fold protein YncE